MKFAFYKAKDKLFHIVCSWKMEGPYSHVEAIFGPGKENPNLSLCASSAFLDGGVRFKEIDITPEIYDVIEIDLPKEVEDKAYQWFVDHEGQPYDTRGLIQFITPFPVGHTEGGWFCDEACLTSIGMEEAFRFDPNSMASVLKYMGGKVVPL